MANMSRADREAVVEQLSRWLRGRVLDPANDVAFALRSGRHGEIGDELGPPIPEPNGTWTLVVRINGGARDTGALADGPPGA